MLTNNYETQTTVWGPVRDAAGRMLFRLWAPSAEKVLLRLNGENRPMQKSDEGLFSLAVADAAYGASYGFVLPDGRFVPDPASRAQTGDVHSPSRLVDPEAYAWQQEAWPGRALEEAVFYEIHIGTFSEAGTFRAAIEKLPALAATGITAIELMPLAHFPGRRGWGYDGVLQFAPHSVYGSPDDLKALVDAAHGLGMMIFLDVVYNHFGPEGNYLPSYAPAFARNDRDTPWGAAIDYHEPWVRQYFIENVLYWLLDFRFDGLRLDAVDQIEDPSEVHILREISETVRRTITDRKVHLVLENPPNGTDMIAPRQDGRGFYDADWNDDFHHIVHVIATGENAGHYADFADRPWEKLKTTLSEGYLRPGKPILDSASPPAASLPPTAYVHFVQNHDQIGNRALGDRLHTSIDDHSYRMWMALLLLSPQIPLLFMGDDYRESRPFHFFADYNGEIGAAVRENRPKEAVNFGGIPEGVDADELADPNMLETFQRSRLDWNSADAPDGIAWREFIRTLLHVRREKIVPLLPQARGYAGRVAATPDGVVALDWVLGDATLGLRANFTDLACDVGAGGQPIYSNSGREQDQPLVGTLSLQPGEITVFVDQ